jgi:hypothetical protein
VRNRESLCVGWWHIVTHASNPPLRSGNRFSDTWQVIIFTLWLVQWLCTGRQTCLPTFMCVLYSSLTKYFKIYISILSSVLRPLGFWDRGFESRWGHGCLSLVFICCVVLCRQRPLWRADHSSKGVLPCVLIRLRNLSMWTGQASYKDCRDTDDDEL